MNKRMPWRVLELACWVTGLALLALWSVAFFGGEAEREQAIAEFTQTRAGIVAGNENPASDSLRHIPVAIVDPPSAASVPPASAAVASETLPIALLRIPRIALEVPVFEDTSERNLNRGAGWIEGPRRQTKTATSRSPRIETVISGRSRTSSSGTSSNSRACRNGASTGLHNFRLSSPTTRRGWTTPRPPRSRW